MRTVVAHSFLMFCLVAAGCRKSDKNSGRSPGSQAAQPSPGVTIENLAANPSPAPAEPPAAPVPPTPAVEPDSSTPAPASGAGLSAEARKKRNLEWLKILATGSPQQQQKVQDQLTLLPSEQLQELTELYQQQQNKK